MVRINGVRQIRRMLRRTRQRTAAGAERGLIKAGLMLQRESQRIVPVDTGVLRNSARTRAEGSGFDTRVIVSYGTSYAIFVHEILTNNHKPGKSPKFLEWPAVYLRQDLIEVIRKEMAK